MIKVTKFNGEELILNSDLIETIQATPDTVIRLTTGRKMLIREDIDEIIFRVIEYKRQIFVENGVE